MSKLSKEIDDFKSSLSIPQSPISMVLGRRWLAVLLILILTLLGVLLWALFAVTKVVFPPPTVLVVQPAPDGAPMTKVVASESFNFPSFKPGESCTEQQPLLLAMEDQKHLSEFLESTLCQSENYDALAIIGGHDSQPLGPVTSARYGSNRGLADHRATCIKRHVEVAVKKLASTCSPLPTLLILATKGSSTESEPHSELVKLADRSGLVIFYRSKSGEAP